MNLKNISLLFIVLFGVNLLALLNSGGDGSWGIPLSALTFLILIAAYAFFWFGGNMKCWLEYQKPDKKLVGWLINLPALGLAIAGFLAWADNQPPNAAFTLHVINEMNEPIEGAEIRFGTQKDAQIKITDNNGLVSWQRGPFTSSKYLPSYEVNYKDYYPSYGHGFDKPIDGTEGTWPLKHYKPWNPVIKSTLMKIKNPVPLYMKGFFNLDIEHLSKGNEHGYDLIVGDWLPPNGKGVVADFLMKLELSENQFEHGYLLLNFAGTGNGIQRVETNPRNYSLLKLPHNAPTSGYQSSLKLKVGHDLFDKPLSESFRSGNYFFRIRNQKNQTNIVSGGLYGKIIGLIHPYYNRDNKRYNLSMKYYLNPNPDVTNLEYDPNQNLFLDTSNTKKTGRIFR